MRWLWLFLAATVACCNWPAATDTSTTGTGGSSTCPQTSSCADCKTCALSGGCATLWATCEANSDCQAIDECWLNCATGDTACQSNCLADSPNGSSDYEAVNSCVYCTECPTACAGQCTGS